jgi:23S rRNA (uracil1939-C5)-methyltransferase
VGRAADGRVVFVPFAAPGDRLVVRVVESHPRFARAAIEAVLEPGTERIAAPCPAFGRCGGCAWQHLGYPAQIEAKRTILRDALARIGGLAPPPIEFVPSPAPYGYRSRARLLVAGGAVGFRARRSHAPCAIDRCPLLAPPLDAALAALAGDPPADGEWELALGAGGSVRVSALPARPGGERIAVEVAGRRIEASPGVFFQANALLLDALARAVVDAAGEGGELLELFAGAGFFTLALAGRFARAAAVEADPIAVRDLAHNLAVAAIRSVRVIEARAEVVLADPRAQRLAPDVVVLDPPRGGLGPRPAARLARLAAHRVVYVSCDPATLGRDLGVLAARGMTVRRVVGFDLFPQTPHVEAMVVLERAGGAAAG